MELKCESTEKIKIIDKLIEAKFSDEYIKSIGKDFNNIPENIFYERRKLFLINKV